MVENYMVTTSSGSTYPFKRENDKWYIFYKKEWHLISRFGTVRPSSVTDLNTVLGERAFWRKGSISESHSSPLKSVSEISAK